MMRFPLAASIIVSVFFLSGRAVAQGNQTVVNGSATNAVNFPTGGCSYNWVNSTPGIGLPASGTGDIAAFAAVNTGTTPVTATITATPAPSGVAYIANQLDGTVSVINLATNRIVATVKVGALPQSVTVSPDGTHAYVTSRNDNNVTVIDTKTNQVIAIIPVNYYPLGIAVSPDGKSVYVVKHNQGSISVISTASNTVVADIPETSDIWDLRVTPDGSKLYVTDYSSNTVTVIDLKTNATITKIPAGAFPLELWFTPDGSKLYVTNTNSNDVSVISTLTNAVIATINVGTAPKGITITPDGKTAYVANYSSNNVSIINTATNKVIKTIQVGLNPYDISASPDGSDVFVVNTGSNLVSVISTATNTVIATIPVGSQGNIPAASGNFIAPGCGGSPITFTITVKPSSVAPTITAGTVTGTISACQGLASASPNVEQFTVSGTGLTNNITATAPTGFEVSLSANSNYDNSVIIPQTGGTANNTVVYVRSAISVAGSITGNITLTAEGANTRDIAVTGTIKPLPAVNNVSNQVVSSGSSTTAIDFTGTANTFNWTNNNPTIGLPASGTGYIAPFTAVNNGTTPITATITATPMSSGYAYVGNEGDGTLSVISTETNKVIKTIPVGSAPTFETLSIDGNRLFVVNSESNTISEINTTTNVVVSTITANSSNGIALSPDGNTLYSVNSQTSSLAVINIATNTVTSNITLGDGPADIVTSPNGALLYVSNLLGNNILVINAATHATIANIPVGTSPEGLVISPDGKFVYVANNVSNTVSVINTGINAVISTINVGGDPSFLAVSPNGKYVYVTNRYDNSVSVINTANNSVIAVLPTGTAPLGISASPDGNFIYIANQISNNVTVLNAADNTVWTTITIGSEPGSPGNFVTSGSGCTGTPITFTITINPLSVTPTITAGPLTGTISACEGSPSVSPHIGQFTVSGNNLTNGIVATAPPGVQLSLSATGAYSNILTIPQSGGTANNVTIYVGLAAAAAGNISGNVTLTSQGAANQTVTVTGKVNALPTVGPIANQKVVNGSFTKEVDFTGTGDTYNWVNDNPAIGIGYGTSTNIVQFIGTNTSNVPMTGTFTVTPINTSTGCSGTPVTFTIEVDPILPAVITASGTLSPLSTIYGAPSASTSFSISGANMSAGILVTPPTGFEVSTDNTNFSQTVTVGASGTIANTTVYVRLTSKTPVSSYSGNIVLSSQGATYVIVAIPYSIVSPAPLTITANNVQKRSGQTLANGFVSMGFTSSGLQNNESIGSVFMAYNNGADAAAKVGTYTGSVVPSVASGGSFDPKNYTITYKAGDIIVTEGIPNQPVAIPNAFTPNGDGINDVWNIKSLIDYPSCLVSIFTRYGNLIYQSKGYTKPWDGIYNGNPLPTGTYYYIINLQNGQQPLSGYVALIR